MHELLERQLINQYGSLESVPPDLKNFLEAVDKTYTDYSSKCTSLENLRALILKESQELNESLRTEIEVAKKHAAELERFGKLTVGRELRMLELKKENKQLKAKLDLL